MDESVGSTIRSAGRKALAQALADTRRDTLALFAVYEAALGATAMQVPCRPELNLPLWELGHIGWFQEWWIARNAERHRGVAAHPDVPRREGVRPGADALYDSSRVPHASRWALPLPDADATRADLSRQLARTLDLLADAPETDDALYFFRLALLHEDMHVEAARYMAQTLAIDLPATAALAVPDTGPQGELTFPPGRFMLGRDGPGFAFDNERLAHAVDVAGFHIDRRAVNWAEYLPFIEDTGHAAPRDLRRADGGWQQRHGTRWRPLDPQAPASHLSFFEAEAWCRWAARRLPTEAEWERAAVEGGEGFAWGDVWEWTASAFAPYPGFTPHPYRDYSAPWFDGRPVLRGASWATQARMRHPRYRNYFPPGRNDVVTGFRTCRA